MVDVFVIKFYNNQKLGFHQLRLSNLSSYVITKTTWLAYEITTWNWNDFLELISDLRENFNRIFADQKRWNKLGPKKLWLWGNICWLFFSLISKQRHLSLFQRFLFNIIENFPKFKTQPLSPAGLVTHWSGWTLT